MVFTTGSALLDSVVLAVVSKEPNGTYGYKITGEVREVLSISESTLYPVLRRLQKDDIDEIRIDARSVYSFTTYVKEGTLVLKNQSN